MKRLVLFISVLFSAAGLMAQSTVETVHLKNGGLVKGEIIEQVPGQSLKVKTKDGNIFVYQMDEVERITKEHNTVSNEGHRGLDFNIDLGYNLPTKSGSDGCPTAELSLGKRFSRSFYWGLGAGAYIPTSGGDVQIPITTEAKMYFPLGSSKLTPFVSLKGGYIINTADDIHQTVGSGKAKVSVDVEQSNYALLQLMPGISFPLSGSVDFNLAAGYAHTIKVGGDIDGGGAFVVRAGFGFHKNVNSARRPPIPTRDRGFQLTLEADAVEPWNLSSDNRYGNLGPNIVLGYKLNPNLSVGVGFGASMNNVSRELGDEVISEEYFDKQTTTEGSELVSRGKKEISRREGREVGSEEGYMYKFFVRGQYRLNDKRFSPIVGIDLGYRTISFDDDLDWYEYLRYETKQTDESWDDKYEFSKSSLFVNPSVGFSLRTTNNSYFEMKVGYALYGKIVGKSAENDYHTSGYGGDYHRYTNCEQKDSKLSGLYMSIGWTHTFGSRKR